MRNAFLLLIISYGYLQAQAPDSIQYSSVKIDVINLFDRFPAILISFEHSIGKSLALSHEAGPVLPMFNAYKEDIKGYKLKEEIRMYAEQWSNTDLYIGFSLRHSLEKMYKNAVVGYDCQGNRNCAYYRNFPGYFTKRMYSLDLRVGFRHNISPYFIEYDLGYGYGQEIIDSPDHETGTNGRLISSDPFNLQLEGWKVMISARANIGFKFKKKRQPK